MIRIHSFMPCSRVNGPGLRAVLWLQGCTLACPGCASPRTHPLDGGTDLDETSVAHRIVSDYGAGIEGVTISGGEPFLQDAALEKLLVALRDTSSLSVLLYSGYLIEEILRMRHGPEVLSMTDILVDGRYDAGRRIDKGFIGSSNQRIHLLSSRYGPFDLSGVIDTEARFGSDGVIVLTAAY
jgi:anaerobic ribonucleoside-triphosphate reductase activating protein